MSDEARVLPWKRKPGEQPRMESGEEQRRKYAEGLCIISGCAAPRQFNYDGPLTPIDYYCEECSKTACIVTFTSDGYLVVMVAIDPL